MVVGKEIRVQFFGENLVEAIRSGSWWTVAALVIAVLMFRFRRFVEDFDWHRARRVRVLKESLRSQILDESSRKIVEDELRTLLLARACGQRIEAPIREMIVRLHQADARKLTMPKLVAASRFLVVSDQGRPSIEIPRFDTVEHVFNIFGTVVSFGVILAAIVLLGIAAFAGQAVSAGTVLKLFGLIGVFTLVLAHIAGVARPYVVARSIRANVAAASKLMSGEQLSRERIDAELGGDRTKVVDA